MKENTTYGECLTNILQALDLKSSRLAREINIDSSLIYKWLRNERVPSCESPYIELILKCIEKRLANSSQRKAVINVLTNYEIDLTEPDDTCILNNLRLILQESQGYSIQLHNKMKIRYKFFSPETSTVAGFIENMDTKSGASGNCDDLFSNTYDTVISAENLSCGRDHVQIIKGTLEILYSVMNLLRQAPKTPHPNGNTILITYNSDIRLLHTANDINTIMFKTFYDLLSGGWDIIFKIKLDNNVDRTIKIIEYIQALLAAGSLTIYYDGQPGGYCSETELCIVPRTGALLGFSTNIRNQVDSAFLFRSKKSMEMLAERFFNDLNSARSLLKPYPPQESTEFQHAFAETEEILGDKYVFKGGLSTVTIPLNLYEKYLRLSGKSDQEISHRMFLHKRRLDAFETQVRYFKFKDICFIESLDVLVDKKRYSPDENYIFNNSTPDGEDIIHHLENLIGLLNRCDNYNVAFVSRTQFTQTATVNWMVKGKDNVMIEAFKSDSYSGDSPHSERNFVITEKGVASAFHDYFLILWDNIPNERKNKKNTIAWLKSLIKKCGSGSCTDQDSIRDHNIN